MIHDADNTIAPKPIEFKMSLYAKELRRQYIEIFKD